MESNTLIFITRFREQYQWRYSVLDSELELLTDSSATIQDVLDTLDILWGWSLADNNGDGNSDDFGSLEAGAEAFDDTALQAFTTAAETTKTSLQGAFSQNDVRNFMTRTYGGMMNTLQELGLI